MKKIYFILTAILIPILVNAQQAFSVQERKLYIFIAPVVEIGEIAGETGLSSGMMGGLAG